MTSTATPAGTVTRYLELLQEQDTDAIVELYVDDAEIIPDQAPSLSGLAAIRTFYEDTFRTIALLGDLRITSVTEFADVAIVRSEEPATVRVQATGEEISSYFRELFVVERRGDGWAIRSYMFSQNPGQAL